MNAIDKHEKQQHAHAQQQFDNHIEKITKLQKLLNIEEKRLNESINSYGEKSLG